MENTLRETQLVSLGKLLAGYTHELKNHLAIINESSGLMGDLLEMSEGENKKNHQRFKKIITAIGERIAQANTMAMYLNRVAHRMDAPASTFNVNDLLIEELALMDRFAATKQIFVEKNFQKDIPPVNSNPSLLQFIIFLIVNELLETLECGSTIQILSYFRGQDIEICIESAGPFSSAEQVFDSGSMYQILDYAAEKIDIDLNRSASEGGYHKNTLTLPLGQEREMKCCDVSFKA